jgi:hypothetical protein
MTVLLSCCTNENTVWKETVGTICDRGLKASWICYDANGKSYNERVNGWYSNTVKGEKYVIRFNIDDPKHIEIDTWHPVFEDSEQTFYATGLILAIQRSKFLGDAVVYIFRIHSGQGKKIEKMDSITGQLQTTLS